MKRQGAAAGHLMDGRTSGQDHRILATEGEIAVRCWSGEGQGVPVVLLHDSLGSIELWRDFPARLAEATGRSVIAYDRPGFGHSHPLSLRPFSDFVVSERDGAFRSVLEAFGIRDFVVLGHSVGGGMSLAVAASYPDRCRAVVSISAQSFLEPLTREGIRVAEAAFAEPVQKARLERYHGSRTDWVLDAWIGSWLSDAFDGWNLDAELVRITPPLLAIHGARDEYGSPEQLARIARLVRGRVTTSLMPDAGHFPHRSHEAETLAAITAFLADIR